MLDQTLFNGAVYRDYLGAVMNRRELECPDCETRQLMLFQYSYEDPAVKPGYKCRKCKRPIYQTIHANATNLFAYFLLDHIKLASKQAAKASVRNLSKNDASAVAHMEWICKQAAFETEKYPREILEVWLDSVVDILRSVYRYDVVYIQKVRDDFKRIRP
ncbi:hypothetical protein [Vibrio phage vB_VmeM-Yong XC32]|nr:hypothetical protein [Vibrio phage vB_VmeM-Yong XC31]QAX96589.1 hypothetical protein [Vibrio phage vB_VmeM-Yong XC32]QAX96907.1 hypothetical protein [Vibrio phage vB_VmeM-Yong MS31]QAX97212.1 hypothetical protein [Vibrio phage vB_VmeM-Yong MS32]